MGFTSSRAGKISKKLISRGILVSSLLLIISCQKTHIKETHYATGEIRTTSEYITGPNSEIILHGVQVDWFRNGKTASVDRYNHGIQQGYAFQWYPNGKLKSVVHFTDGLRGYQPKYYTENGENISSPLAGINFSQSN